jgi:hypothetical protein
MLNITDGIATLRAAEHICTSSLLEKDEKAQLLSELLGTMPPDFGRPYVLVINAALERLYGKYTPRKAVGKQDATQVATGPGEGSEAPSSGPSEGKPEQAEDAGGLPGPSDDGNASSEAPAEAQKPKLGKARK